MKNSIGLAIFSALIFFSYTTVSAIDSASIIISPVTVIQGEPILIAVSNADASEVQKISFDTVSLGIFTYQNKPTAIVGIDLYKKPGTYPVLVTLADGQILETKVIVGTREKIEAPLGIPEKLGGNTPASQTKLVTSLAAENKSLVKLRTGTKSFWKEAFRFPLKEITITDDYGYSRTTGAYSIAHKGTDFRAKEGTAIKAINRGVVRVAKEYRNYGKTVVVDHGLGLTSLYMHLSKIKVNVGELVLPGQVIGLSGKTGYATSPHLHLSVRLNDISIDPLKFFELFK
ncbi:MAG: M23 family metallopeptidase [Patescibacteria group bacterium]